MQEYLAEVITSLSLTNRSKLMSSNHLLNKSNMKVIY